MSMPEAGKAWGQLVSITDLDSAPILLYKEKITIGRAKACDLSFGENKLVSGHHCHVERDDEGRVWLCDTSTNGTLWNLEEKVKGQRKELKHGDEFHVVYKKTSEDLNVGYMYQDLSELEREENEDTLDYSDVLEATLVDTDANEVDFDSRKRNQEERSDSPAPAVKRRKTEESTSEKNQTKPDLTGGHVGSKHCGQERTDDVTGTDVTSADTKAAKELDTVETKEVSQTEKPSVTKDGIEETLLCIICQEIFHDCISLQPCLHSFCAGCYSDWMKRSNECPSCRMKVDRINRNHMVNNLVEAYLREHPDKKRPEEDIQELEAKNKITRDMLYPKRRRRHYSGSDNSDDEDEYTDESTESFDETPYINPAPGPVGGVLFGLGTPLFGTVRPPPVLCRQCPGYVDAAAPATDKTQSTDSAKSPSGETTVASGAGSSTTEATRDQPNRPSTSGEQLSSNQNTDDVKIMPTPPPYRCRANQNHVLCACCFQPMPDRRTEHKDNPAVPPMSCSMCYRNYCHAYWGCRKADCLGCFCKFGDMNFGKKSLTNLILDNLYESQILADYLKSKSISVKAMLKSCLTKMERGEYVCQDRGRFNLSSQAWLCYSCALRNFKELAYYYRRDIPRNQLPAEVTARPNCYWGKNCRTQRGKPHHAKRYNHICDQSRTA